MNPNLASRPRFFTGQMIDYRDFNKLAARPDELLSAILSQLYPGGGLINQSPSQGEVFALRLHAGLSLECGAGTAILPNGQALNIPYARLIDLASFTADGQSKVLIVLAKNVVRGDQHYVDPEDNTINGYLSECFDVEIFFMNKEKAGPLPPDAVELFRVVLGARANHARRLSAAEEWMTEIELQQLVRDDASLALIDTRFRKVLAPTLAAPYGFDQGLALRKALLGIRAQSEKIAQLYLVPDPFHCEYYATLLQAELISQPFQAEKISFLLAQLAEKLSLYLEHLLRKTASTRSDFKREIALETIQCLEAARFTKPTGTVLPLDALLKVNEQLRAMLEFSETHFSLSGTVREALQDIRGRNFGYLDKISIAGRVFERIDTIELSNEARWHSQPAENHRRKISASFRDGTEASLTGAFVRNGRFSIGITARHVDRPLLILMTQYLRRAGTKLHYELNGKALESDHLEDPSIENSWIHKGIVVAPELLVSGENQFSIHVEKTDLDFGFFGATVYQPLLAEVPL